MASTYLTIEIWITITALYLVMTLTFSLGVGKLEAYMARSQAWSNWAILAQFEVISYTLLEKILWYVNHKRPFLPFYQEIDRAAVINSRTQSHDLRIEIKKPGLFLAYILNCQAFTVVRPSFPFPELQRPWLFHSSARVSSLWTPIKICWTNRIYPIYKLPDR